MPSLASCAASAPPRGLWDQVIAALMWRPQARITAKVLSQSLPRPGITEPAAHAPQPAKGCVDASQPVAEFPAGLPAGLSMTQSTKSPAASMDLTTLPRCIPSTRQGVLVCKCSGHCTWWAIDLARTRSSRCAQTCTWKVPTFVPGASARSNHVRVLETLASSAMGMAKHWRSCHGTIEQFGRHETSCHA